MINNKGLNVVKEVRNWFWALMILGYGVHILDVF